ncbi:MAG: phosphoribosylanthranilate isomerase [Halobacteria archaeon]
MVRVKICGMTRENDVKAAVDAGADAVGFVTEVPVDTDRSLSRGDAGRLVEYTPPYVTTVLVIMPDTLDEAVEMAEAAEPDVLQIHNDFDEIEELDHRTDAKLVVKKDPGDVAAPKGADALIVDTPGKKGAGGTGETHDWEKSRRIVEESGRPVVLAGGLTPENVSDAVHKIDPYGVDVSSGVEKFEGIKHHGKVREFVENAGRANINKKTNTVSEEGGLAADNGSGDTGLDANNGSGEAGLDGGNGSSEARYGRDT